MILRKLKLQLIWNRLSRPKDKCDFFFPMSHLLWVRWLPDFSLNANRTTGTLTSWRELTNSPFTGEQPRMRETEHPALMCSVDQIPVLPLLSCVTIGQCTASLSLSLLCGVRTLTVPASQIYEH